MLTSNQGRETIEISEDFCVVEAELAKEVATKSFFNAMNEQTRDLEQRQAQFNLANTFT